MHKDFPRYELLSSDFSSSPDGQTESNTYEPTMQSAQVGAKMGTNGEREYWDQGRDTWPLISMGLG